MGQKTYTKSDNTIKQLLGELQDLINRYQPTKEPNDESIKTISNKMRQIASAQSDPEEQAKWNDKAEKFEAGGESDDPDDPSGRKSMLHDIGMGLAIILGAPVALVGATVFAAGAIIYGAGTLVKGIGNVFTWGAFSSEEAGSSKKKSK